MWMERPMSEGFKPMFSTGRAYLEVRSANARLTVLTRSSGK